MENNTPQWACAELLESNGSVTYIKGDLRNAEYTKNILYLCLQNVTACVYNLPKAGVVGEVVSISML